MIDLNECQKWGSTPGALETMEAEESDEELKKIIRETIRYNKGVTKGNKTKPPEVKKKNDGNLFSGMAEPKLKKPAPIQKEEKRESRYLLIKLILPSYRAITIAKQVEWEAIVRKLKKMNPTETLYFVGEFNTGITIKDFFAKVKIEADPQKINAFLHMIDGSKWLGTDLIIWIKDILQVLEADKEDEE